MHAGTTKKRKLPPGQQALVTAIQSGSTVIRSCGSYWLKEKDHPKDRQWAPLHTATVSALIQAGILKSDVYNRLDTSFALDSTKLDGAAPATESPAP